MNVAILGVGKIGTYHVREYIKNNCNVIAILESSEELVKEKIEFIKKEYGITVKGYFDLKDLLKNEKIDAVSVCTPPDKHYEQVKICLENNINVICEKPFVIGKNNLKLAEELITLAQIKKKVITVNTQWPSVIGDILYFIGSDIINEFYFFMEPGINGVGLLTEALPHANSMLIKLLGNGDIKNINFLKKENEKIILIFDYVYSTNICKVKYEINYKEKRPRKVKFSINNKLFTREYLQDNSQVLKFEDKNLKINDPFSISLKKFINSINNKDKPLITSSEILFNLEIQNLLLKKYYY